MNFYSRNPIHGQCEACDATPAERPIHIIYGLCEPCVRARGWSDDPDAVEE